MADAATRMLDVWIVDLKKVYTGVPFTVVTDWIQQGRLLAKDNVRLAGKTKWHLVEAVPALVPYLPKPAPFAVEDRAEALAPVDLGFQTPKVHEEEDDDIDMIPLIDVSLVLLIFFMMTAAINSGIFSTIATPEAKHQLTTISDDMYWLGIETKNDETHFSLGRDSDKKQYLVDPTQEASEVYDRLLGDLKDVEGEVKLRLRGEKSLPIETIKGVTTDLQAVEASINQGRDAKRRVQIVILGEVSEPK